MKVYKMVYLNKGLSMTREKDLVKAENTLNEYIAQGWILQQVVCPSDSMGALVAVMYREE